MAIAKREQVLARLFDVLATVNGVESTVRNRGLLGEDARPALVQLDGDETNVLPGPVGQPRMAPALVRMQPQIFIVLKNAKPQNKDVGPTLNQFRALIIRAIATDAQLLALLGSNGKMSYDGCETDLKTGMLVEGQMQLNFSLTCVLDPYK